MPCAWCANALGELFGPEYLKWRPRSHRAGPGAGPGASIANASAGPSGTGGFTPAPRPFAKAGSQGRLPGPAPNPDALREV